MSATQGARMPSGWSSVEIASKTCDVFDPPAPPRFAAVFLHAFGLESLLGNTSDTEQLASRNLACVCPHGQRGWWLDRVSPDFDPAITPEKFVTRHVVPFAEKRWSLRPRT